MWWRWGQNTMSISTTGYISENCPSVGLPEIFFVGGAHFVFSKRKFTSKAFDCTTALTTPCLYIACGDGLLYCWVCLSPWLGAVFCDRQNAADDWSISAVALQPMRQLGFREDPYWARCCTCTFSIHNWVGSRCPSWPQPAPVYPSMPMIRRSTSLGPLSGTLRQPSDVCCVKWMTLIFAGRIKVTSTIVLH